MKIDIKIPAMGESITEAKIGALLKPSGSIVNVDDEILELETDKVNQVIYAPQGGVVTLNVNTGQTVKIGQVVGTIETDKQAKSFEEKAPAENKEIEKKKEAPRTNLNTPPSLEPPVVKGETEKAGIRLTKEVFLEEFSTKEVADKEVSEPLAFIKPQLSQNKEVKEAHVSRQKMSRVRRVIADKLVEAQRTSAMLTTFNEVDMSQIINLREKYKDIFAKKHGIKLGFMSFFVKAVVASLAIYPSFNSYIEGEDIVHREYYNIGIAVGAEKGLFVPVVRDCDQLSFSEIESAIEKFALKVREGKISIEDLQGGGFTITNGGIYGSLLSTPILNPPQCGILGMHKINKRPVVIEDQIVIKPMMYLALSYDHRLVDGKEAVSFLVLIKDLLEDPARIFLNV
jgi:2-oxoglutarate dehydrogenase E2 component (dihydrolipoamide succinyltransferase)